MPAVQFDVVDTIAVVTFDQPGSRVNLMSTDVWNDLDDILEPLWAQQELRGLMLRARPIERPGTLWVHELVGATVESSDGRELGVVAAVEANPASDLLVLADGGLVPLRFVVSHEPGQRVVVDVPDGLFD